MRDTKTEEPDFANDEGVKWWHEQEMTRYAHNKGLTGVRVWTVERQDGYKTRLLTEGSEILADDQTVEGLGIKIDVLAFQKRTAGE